MLRMAQRFSAKGAVAILLLSGAVAILIGAVLGQLLESIPRQTYPTGYYALSVTTEVLKIAGSTVVITGLISVVIDAVHWRTYFEERLRDIVIDQDYLKGLDEGTLRGLHTKLLRVFQEPRNGRTR